MIYSCEAQYPELYAPNVWPKKPEHFKIRYSFGYRQYDRLHSQHIEEGMED